MSRMDGLIGTMLVADAAPPPTRNDVENLRSLTRRDLISEMRQTN